MSTTLPNTTGSTAVHVTVRTYRFRLKLTKRQHASLEQILESQRILYNEAIGWKRFAWEVWRTNISYSDLSRWLTGLRKSNPILGQQSLRIQRSTITRVIHAFDMAFRRCDSGKPPGWPRFKGKHWWKSFALKEMDGAKLSGDRLTVKGVPGVMRVCLHRDIPNGRILGCAFKRDHKGWQVTFQVRVPVPEKPKAVFAPVGLDVGLTSLATFSSGRKVGNQRYGKIASGKLRIAQRHVSRCVRGSRGYRKALTQVVRCHAKTRNARDTYLHQVSSGIVKSHDFLAVEKLNIKGLSSSPLGKSILDAAWSRLMHMLMYKAESAGCWLVAVDPRGTTQECSRCSQVVQKVLSERLHKCSCGCVLDRDVNAARNILHRAVMSPGGPNVVGNDKRALGNALPLA